MKCEDCSVPTNADAVYRMITDKTDAVSYVFNALGCFDFLDDIEDTIKLFAG